MRTSTLRTHYNKLNNQNQDMQKKITLLHFDFDILIVQIINTSEKKCNENDPLKYICTLLSN